MECSFWRQAEKPTRHLMYPHQLPTTVRDATADILTMTRDLLVRKAAQETDRCGSCFVDPSTRGMEEKVAKGWIEDILGRSTTVEEQDT